MSLKINYTNKYLKYKTKYISLKKMTGGSGGKTVAVPGVVFPLGGCDGFVNNPHPQRPYTNDKIKSFMDKANKNLENAKSVVDIARKLYRPYEEEEQGFVPMMMQEELYAAKVRERERSAAHKS